MWLERERFFAGKCLGNLHVARPRGRFEIDKFGEISFSCGQDFGTCPGSCLAARFSISGADCSDSAVVMFTFCCLFGKS
jgi:hypothetical protein